MNHSISRRLFIKCAGVSAGISMSGCGRRHAANVAPSVVILILDTVRARSCSAWGFARNTTPHLKDFSEHATRFARARSTAPWTLPSHASMLTGRYTCQHGARGYAYRDDAGLMRMRETPLPDAMETLAERLLREGYTTAMYSANDGYLSAYYNLSQGFETYHVERMPGLDLVGQSLDWIDGETQRPFFLCCNVMDAHSPYNLTPCPDSLPEPVSSDATLLEAFRALTLENTAPLDASLASAVSAQYELGVANADRAAGRLIAGLQDRGLYNNTLLIIASDHGEYLGEHMLVEHSKDVYEEALHVPLLIKWPGQSLAHTEEKPCSLVQVTPTVLAALGQARPADFPPALNEPQGDFPLLAENYYSRDWDVRDPRWKGRFNRIRRTIVNETWKYINSSDGRHELFHLGRDPLEQTNCIDSEAGMARVMAERFATAIGSLPNLSSEPANENPGPSATEQEALHSLGYL